ncbi:MAG: hypothetical protein AAF411_04645 [Myxococcota bacterium]
MIRFWDPPADNIHETAARALRRHRELVLGAICGALAGMIAAGLYVQVPLGLLALGLAVGLVILAIVRGVLIGRSAHHAAALVPHFEQLQADGKLKGTHSRPFIGLLTVFSVAVGFACSVLLWPKAGLPSATSEFMTPSARCAVEMPGTPTRHSANGFGLWMYRADETVFSVTEGPASTIGANGESRVAFLRRMAQSSFSRARAASQEFEEEGVEVLNEDPPTLEYGFSMTLPGAFPIRKVTRLIYREDGYLCEASITAPRARFPGSGYLESLSAAQ